MALDATQTSTIGSGPWPLFLKLTIGRLALTSDAAKRRHGAGNSFCIFVLHDDWRTSRGGEQVCWRLAFAFLPTP